MRFLSSLLPVVLVCLTCRLIVSAQSSQFFGAPVYPLAADAISAATADLNNDNVLDLVLGNLDGTVTVLLGNGDGSFLSATTYTVGLLPISVAATDFDKDGAIDVAVALSDRKSVAVLLGNGDGTLRVPIEYAISAEPESIVVGDVNGDGNPDLLVSHVVHNTDFTFSTLVGNGDGTFQSAIAADAGGGPELLATGDLNGDGYFDVVTGNYLSENLSVVLSNGDGSFQAPVFYALQTGIADTVVISDLNGDGILDVAVGSDGKFSVEVFLGNGDGTLASSYSVKSGLSPFRLIVADLNNDRQPDLLVSDFTHLRALLNTGGGTFELGDPYLQGVPAAPVAGDFNGDGKLDVVTPGYFAMSFVAGGGDGNFATVASYQAGALAESTIASADLNGDGALDIITANSSMGEIAVAMGLGDGTFQTGGAFKSGHNPTAIAVADFNGDGRADVAVAGLIDFPDESKLTIELGNGDGTFTAGTQYSLKQCSCEIAVADFNGDGNVDIATANYFGDRISILLGNGDGTFQRRVDYDAGGNPDAIAVGDFNGDGAPDIAVTNSNAYQTGRPGLTIFIANGDGTFLPAVFYRTDPDDGALVAADFNQDGKLDVIVATSQSLDVFLGNGDGTFQKRHRQDAGSAPGRMVAADFDRDGRLDLAVLVYPNVNLLLGNGNGTFRPPESYLAGKDATAILAADFNQDGAPDLATADGYINVLLNTGKHGSSGLDAGNHCKAVRSLSCAGEQ